MAQAQSLLAACGGDTVKLFDVSVERGDPCIFQHAPSPGLLVNCARWNHTNLVLASAGDDRKISLWMKNGLSVGVLPEPSTDTADSVEESILAICFSTKLSRYMCSGGSGKVVRVWDLQRERCIKWLKGHVETITGVGYNCRDEQLASVSISGDLILHNLASGTRAAELKDPNDQVLRVLEYSRFSRHLLVTAGDDGSVHLWDTTGRTPKVSWIKQHCAPTTGVCFSPANDKLIVSVGLDKKLYTFDPGMKKPVHCVPCEAPFSSLACRDDGAVVAAGTNSGRVVFYDIRNKMQPFTILRAYSASEAVSSLSWQRSNPVAVNEANCTLDAALLGSVTTEDSVLMPDPLPPPVSGTRGRIPASALGSRSAARNGEDGGATGTSSNLGRLSDGTRMGQMWTNGSVTRLQTPRSAYGADDDMEVFSPLVEVQPITPSLSNTWDENYDFRRDLSSGNMTKTASWGQGSPNSVKKFPNLEDLRDESRQHSAQKDGSPSSPATSRLLGLFSKSPTNSATPPEAWGGDAPIDRPAYRQPPIQGHLVSRFASPTISSGTSVPAELDTFGTPASNAGALSRSSYSNVQGLDLDTARHAAGPKYTPAAHSGSAVPPPAEVFRAGDSGGLLGDDIFTVSSRKLVDKVQVKSSPRSPAGVDSVSSGPPVSAPIPSFNEERTKGTSNGESVKGSSSPRPPKADAAALSVSPVLPVGAQGSDRQGPSESQQDTPSFALQLVQRALEESLGAMQEAIHEDVQNLHLELLRQFHIQQLEIKAAMSSLQDRQAELIEEVRHLRREHQRNADL